jgi:transglutaminase-like putative cysteine protease
MIKAKHLARIHDKAHSTISTKIVHLSANEAKKGSSAASLPTWDWVAAGLLLAAVFFAGAYAVITQLDENMERIQWLAFAATLIGMTLGASRFSSRQTGILGAAYGLLAIAWQLMDAFARQGATLPAKISILLDRTAAALRSLPDGGSAESSVLFISLLALLFWGIGLNAGNALVRQGDAWRALLPMAAVLVLFYASASDKSAGQIHLVLFLIIALLLIARAHFLDLRRGWGERRTQTPAYIGADFFRSSVYLSLGLIVLAWAIPGLFRSGQAGEAGWNVLFSSFLAADEAGAPTGAGGEQPLLNAVPSYGENLPLGRGTPLGEEIVLTVTPLSEQAPATRYYWRDRVYDLYNQGEWFSTFSEEQLFAASQEPLPFPELEGRRLERFEIIPTVSLFQLHAPAEPVWLDAPAFLQYASNPDGTLDVQALISPLARGPLESYQVESWVTQVTARQLAAAGTDYPDWVSERYLQVPEEITARTRALAAELAEGAENPYEVAVTVTQYLRDTINYQEQIDAPPANQETIDWLLFDYQRGFCNYYAAAEVILLRVLGIPARFAVGYAQGEAVIISAEERSRDLNIEAERSGVDFYTVRQRDAHAWPEVYFPGIGWVEFEPTVSQQPLGRPVGEDGETPEEQEAAQNAAQERAANPIIALWLRLAGSRWVSPFGLIALGILLAAPLAGLFAWRRHRQRGGQPIPVLLERRLDAHAMHTPGLLRRWARYASMPPLPRSYQEVNRSLRWLGSPPNPGLAPAERAAQLAKRLPQLADMITSLGRAYEMALYSQEQESIQGLAQAQWSIRLATLVVLLRQSADWLQKLPRRFLTGRKPSS